MLRRVLREPLVHFLGLALAVFAVYGLVASPAEEDRGRIVVSAPRIEQMEAIFAQTRMRPPAPEELKALIDDYVAEELFVREALRLGVDGDDTVIRRRLRQKMEFLVAAEAEAQVPTDAELTAYLEAHPDLFRTGARIGFQQVFLDPQRRGAQIGADAQVMLDALNADPEADPERFGDATLLPGVVPLSDVAEIEAVFGPEFASALTDAAPGSWSGPVASGYGQHLVRITSAEDARLPPLGEIREAVAREWTNDRIQTATRERLETLLQAQEVVIDMPEPAQAP